MIQIGFYCGVDNLARMLDTNPNHGDHYGNKNADECWQGETRISYPVYDPSADVTHKQRPYTILSLGSEEELR